MTYSYKSISCLLILSILLCIGCGPNEEALVSVFQRYQSAIEVGDTHELLETIDSQSRQYLLNQLDHLKNNNRQVTEQYINESKHPVLNVDMIARALNHYRPNQIDSLSPKGYLDFNLEYLVQLEKPTIKGFTFRAQLLQTAQRAILKFSKPLDEERNTVADIEFLKENGAWRLNLLDRLNLLENNARITLKYAEQNTWDYVSEKLDNYYPN